MLHPPSPVPLVNAPPRAPACPSCHATKTIRVDDRLGTVTYFCRECDGIWEARDLPPVGPWIGGAAALSRFRDEQGFERRLGWYERMIRGLHDLAQTLEMAVMLEQARQAPRGNESRRKVWLGVQHAYLAVESAAIEADIYGSDTSIRAASSIVARVRRVAHRTNRFDEHSGNLTSTPVTELPSAVRDGLVAFVDEARRHLRIG